MVKDDSKPASPPPDEVERRIAAYLRAHPDYFERHLELLKVLRIPHPCRPAVSLLERKLQLLQDQNGQLRRKLVDLVEVARDNDQLADHLQRLALALIEAQGLDEVLHNVKGVLRDELNADFSALRLAARPLEPNLAGEEEFRAWDPALFESLLHGRRPVCGRLTREQATSLFAEAAPRVASAALVPLAGAVWQGLLAIGSREQGRFYAGMGTLFLSRVGTLVSHALGPHLRAPATPAVS
ncbi:MAG: DUF484 family protein [Pseudomonadota bacterium]|nr:DUF484 family protein [Pseudomonadota bacterium]